MESVINLTQKKRAKMLEQWQLFNERGGVEYGSVRESVLNSWLRSKEAGVNPQMETTPTISKSALNKCKKRRSTLLDVAIPYMKKIYELVSEQGGIAALSDENGIILEAFGDYDSFLIPMAPLPGTSALEKDVGTNGIGTALFEDRAIQIWAGEHYTEGLHVWASVGDTIHDMDGNIIGCLSHIYPWDRISDYALGLIAATAGAIERQLKVEHTLKEKLTVIKEQQAIVNLINEGIILIDKNEIVKNINNQACMMLGVKTSHVVGTHIFDFIVSGVNFSRILAEKKNVFDREATLNLNDKIFNGNMSAMIIEGIDGAVDGLVITIKERAAVHRLVNRVIASQAVLKFNDIIGDSDSLQQSIKSARAAGKSSSNVLLLGESGTGKELFAQSIHNSGVRREHSFIAVNCGALPRNLVESELFGYEGGAFSGSKKEGHPGKFELAEGGTIFLDEIGDMPLEAQVALLRVLESKEIVRVGGKYPKKIDVRVIAATNKNLFELVKNNQFREDLFYRLNVLTVHIPSLRERVSDVRVLVDFFARKASNHLGKTITSITEKSYLLFEGYSWPGNIRELENIVERAVNIAETNQITVDNLPHYMRDEKVQSSALFFSDSLKSQEYQHLIKILEETKGNLRQTALKLGVARSTLYLKMKRYNLSSHRFRNR